jgi:hypothetical protein
VIANVDPNIGQVSGDVGEEIRFFKGFEGRVGLEMLAHRDAARAYNLNAWGTVRRLRGIHWRWRCRQMPGGNHAARANADYNCQDFYARSTE